MVDVSTVDQGPSECIPRQHPSQTSGSYSLEMFIRCLSDIRDTRDWQVDVHEAPSSVSSLLYSWYAVSHPRSNSGSGHEMPKSLAEQCHFAVLERQSDYSRD